MITRPDWTPLPVTAEGSPISYHILAGEMALWEKKPDVIIMEVSKLSYLRGLGRNENHTVPDYLYNPNLETPFNHLLTFDFIKRTLQLAQTDIGPLDGLQSWMPDHFTKFEHGAFMGDLKIKSCELETVENLRLSSKTGAAWKDGVYKGLATFIRENPSTEFRLWFSPRHAIEYYSRPTEVRAILQFRAHVVSALADMPNVKIYDFASSPNLNYQYGDYKDTGHFNLETQSLIFAELQSDASDYIIEKNTWDINYDPIYKAVLDYNPSVHKDCGGSLGQLTKRELDKKAREAEQNYVRLRKDADQSEAAYDAFYEAGIILGRRGFFLRVAEAKFYGWGTNKNYQQVADIVFDRRMSGNAKAQMLRGRLYSLDNEKWFDVVKAREAFGIAEKMGFESGRRELDKLEKKYGL